MVVLVLVLALVAGAHAQSVRTINGTIVMEINGATLTLSTDSAAPSAGSSVLEPSAYFQPQVRAFVVAHACRRTHMARYLHFGAVGAAAHRAQHPPWHSTHL